MTYEMKMREFKQDGYHQEAFESTLPSIKMLMKNTHCSTEKAFAILEIAMPERKKYFNILQNSQ